MTQLPKGSFHLLQPEPEHPAGLREPKIQSAFPKLFQFEIEYNPFSDSMIPDFGKTAEAIDEKVHLDFRVPEFYNLRPVVELSLR